VQPGMTRLSIASFSLSLILVIAAFAQSNTATVYGNVMDQSGAVIANAPVAATNKLTGIRSTAVSNSTGQFTFNFLPVGTYIFEVEAPGFQKQVRDQVPLSAGQTAELIFQLALATSNESVTVSAEATSLNTESAEQHTTVTTKEVLELPLAKRDWSGLLQVGNGVAKAGGSGISLNGLPPSGFYLTVDGTNAFEDSELPTVGFYQSFNTINTINSEAIGEVSFSKGIAPASIGSSMSGTINLITKSGTNQFHGSLVEINSVAAFNARNQFLATKPGSTFNEFGGSFGGPIIRDKLFFFGNYEGTRNSAFTAVTGAVPTKEFVAQVLASQPVFQSILAQFPFPNQPYAAAAQSAQYIGAAASVANDNNAVARFDYYADAKDLVTLRYTRARPYSLVPNKVAIDPRATYGHDDTYNGQYTHSATGWTSVARFGYNRTNILRSDQGYGANLPGFSFGFSVGAPESFAKRGSIFSGEEMIAKTIGRHSLQFGAIVQRNNSGRIDDTTTAYSYSSLADLLANIPNSLSISFPLTLYQLHTYQVGGYVQDDFRVNSNLTFNLGIRYDHFTVPKERDSRVYTRAATSLGPGFGPFKSADHPYDADWLNFAPRLGFAWSIGKDRKTVIRGGSGIFVSPHPIQGAGASMVLAGPNVPLHLNLSRAQALAQGLKYPFDRDPILANIEATNAPISNTAISDHYPNPYSIQWMMSVERELPGGMVFETSYVGNRSLHMNMVRMQNLPDRITGIAPNPDPNFGQFRYYDASDSSWYNALQLSLDKRFSKGLSYGLHYTYASNISYGDADLWLQAPPQDNNNIRADKGPTPFSIRHNFNASVVYELPFGHWVNPNPSRAAKLLLGGWQISSIFTANTGLPGNITESKSAYPSSRPDATGLDRVFSNYTDTLQYLNPAAFVPVPIITASGAAARPGNLGRYAIRMPGRVNVDASLAKSFELSERFHLQLRGDAFNALNHTNLTGLQTDISNSAFGRLTSATARTLQIGARLQF